MLVKPKQAGTCGRGIRNKHIVKSLICTIIKCYRTYLIYLLSRLYAILLFITKKTACKWKFGTVDDASCPAHKGQLVVKLCFFTILSMYIFCGDQCLQCYTLPVITFCLSLRNAIAGYFVFRWFGKWRLINFKRKAPTNILRK